MSMNYNTIGGVMADIHPDFQRKVKEFIKIMPARLKEYNEVFTGNVIARNRMIGVGHLSLEDAYVTMQPVLRVVPRVGPATCASALPMLPTTRWQFDEVLSHEGDSYARYNVRLEEIVQSLHILEQLVDNIPEGDYAVKTKPIIKVPEGRYFKQVEASRGAFGIYLESRGDKTPYRLKVVSPGFALVGVVDHLVRGAKIADLITIGGSLDYVVPDIDR